MTQAEANQLLDQFKAVYAGQKAEYYGYLGECLSKEKRWVDALINKSVPGLNKGKQQAPASGNGKGSGYYTNYANLPALHPYFYPEPWNPAKNYPRGSLVVYSATSHIATYENSGATHATVFEQNADPDGSPAHTAQRANSRIDGILVLRIDAPAPAPVVQKGDKKMNDAEEQDAYQIVLERPREGAPSNRTGIDFMRDARGELTQKRQSTANQLGVMSSQITTLNQTVIDLTTQLKSSETTNAEKQKALNDAITQVTQTASELEAVHGQLTSLQQQPELAKASTDSLGLLAKFFSLFLRKKS